MRHGTPKAEEEAKPETDDQGSRRGGTRGAAEVAAHPGVEGAHSAGGGSSRRAPTRQELMMRNGNSRAETEVNTLAIETRGVNKYFGGGLDYGRLVRGRRCRRGEHGRSGNGRRVPA